MHQKQQTTFCSTPSFTAEFTHLEHPTQRLLSYPQFCLILLILHYSTDFYFSFFNLLHSHLAFFKRKHTKKLVNTSGSRFYAPKDYFSQTLTQTGNKINSLSQNSSTPPKPSGNLSVSHLMTASEIKRHGSFHILTSADAWGFHTRLNHLLLHTLLTSTGAPVLVSTVLYCLSLLTTYHMQRNPNLKP